eukprot:4241471-Pyramimonas_sp.AAC.1
MTSHGPRGAKVLKPAKSAKGAALTPRAAAAASGSGTGQSSSPVGAAMGLGESDKDTWDITFSDEHIRAICANVVAEQLKDLKKEVDSAVAASISESAATESKTIADSFKNNFGKCFSQCQRDLEELPRKLDKQIQDTLNPRLDELRREFTTKYGTLSAIVQGVDTKVEAPTKDNQELKDAVKQLQAELAAANQRPSKPVVVSSAFEGEVDYSVIKVNAGKLMPKAKVQE